MSQLHKVPIPLAVRRDASKGLALRQAGFLGGTATGWNRATQLTKDADISVTDLRAMRAWFARHGPQAKNGGTSYPGYKRWVAAGRPMRVDSSHHKKGDYRGAVAWLLWGGDAAAKWLKSKAVQQVL